MSLEVKEVPIYIQNRKLIPEGKKICTQCKETKSLREFYRNKKRLCGYRAECIVCSKKYKKPRVKEKPNRNAVPSKPAIPLHKVLKMIKKIGCKKVARDIDVPESFVRSWIHHVWQPSGQIADRLQEYLKKKDSSKD